MTAVVMPDCQGRCQGHCQDIARVESGLDQLLPGSARVFAYVLALENKEKRYRLGHPKQNIGKGQKATTIGIRPWHPGNGTAETQRDLRKHPRQGPLHDPGSQSRPWHPAEGIPCSAAALAVANGQQNPSKPVANCHPAYRQAIRTAERHGPKGSPMGYAMGYPIGYPMGYPAPSPRDSRVTHTELGLHNAYRVSGDAQGPTTPEPDIQISALVPLRDQSRSGTSR